MGAWDRFQYGCVDIYEVESDAVCMLKRAGVGADKNEEECSTNAGNKDQRRAGIPQGVAGSSFLFSLELASDLGVGVMHIM